MLMKSTRSIMLVSEKASGRSFVYAQTSYAKSIAFHAFIMEVI